MSRRRYMVPRPIIIDLQNSIIARYEGASSGEVKLIGDDYNLDCDIEMYIGNKKSTF